MSHAATTQTYSQSVATQIPDGSASGLVSQIVISYSATISSIEIVLLTQNGWNGDLYAYLEHNGVISVLLNRPGRTSANPEGAASSGMNVTISDFSVGDIHTSLSSGYGAIAFGSFQPDGRAADPSVVTESSPRSLNLASFNGQTSAGDWILFVADLSSGDVATLVNWSLTVTTVPESSVLFLSAVALFSGLTIRRRGGL